MKLDVRAPLWFVVAVLAALSAPAAASANLYCVNEPACVKAGGSSEGSEGIGLQKALTSAEGHAGSTVEIGPGTYSRAKGFVYASSALVTIRGAGAGATVLTTPLENSDTVLVFHSEGSTLSGLSVAIPAGEGQQGISLDGGEVEGVSISGGAGKDIPTGLAISRGSFSHGSIEMSEAQTSVGVSASGGELLDSTISGSYGVDATIAATIRGCRISSNTFDRAPTSRKSGKNRNPAARSPGLRKTKTQLLRPLPTSSTRYSAPTASVKATGGCSPPRP
jgi:hypothetical protein